MISDTKWFKQSVINSKMIDGTKELTVLENPEDDGPIHFIGDGASYFKGTTATWFTVAIEYLWESDELWAQLVCDLPHPQHWLSYVLAERNLEDILEMNPNCQQCEDHADRLDWMFREGIAPGQRFLVAAHYNSWRDDWTGEQEVEVIWSIKDREPMTDKESYEAWREYIDDRIYHRNHSWLGKEDSYVNNLLTLDRPVG